MTEPPRHQAGLDHPHPGVTGPAEQRHFGGRRWRADVGTHIGEGTVRVDELGQPGVERLTRRLATCPAHLTAVVGSWSIRPPILPRRAGVIGRGSREAGTLGAARMSREADIAQW